MKKLILSALGIISINAYFAQSSTSTNALTGTTSTTPTQYVGSSNNYDLIFRTNAGTGTPVNEWMRLSTGGNFGIGTTAPSVKFEVQAAQNATYAAKIVNGGGYGNGLFIQAGAGIQATTSYSLLNVLDNYGNSYFNIDGKTQYINANGNLTVNKGGNVLRLWANNPGVNIGSSTGAIDFWYSTIGYNQINCGDIYINKGPNTMRIIANNPGTEMGSTTGKISFWYTGVGYNQIDCGNIRANGNLWAQQIKVALTNPFPDYVFEKNYKLKPLHEVETFIQKNGHLSNMPTAQEVAKEGVDVGAVTTILVEKVEELTLYIIQIQKEVEKLKTENSKLKKEGE